MTPSPDHPLTAPHRVERPVMRQGWKTITYAHWRYEPEIVAGLLPAGLQPDVIDGSAWVGLVPFAMERIRPPRGPAIPYLGTFPETNVRTYVRGTDGTPGVYFHSLDVTRLLPVLVARAAYRLPYMWAAMKIDAGAGTYTYSTRRRWPGPAGAGSEIAIRPGIRITDDAVDPLLAFLTARWGLFTQLGDTLAYAPVEHPPWPLFAAELLHLDDQLVAAAGYPPPTDAPLVHFSPGVDVAVGLPRRVEVGQIRGQNPIDA